MSATDGEELFREVRCTLATRPNDLDVLGHVNNAVVLEYLEAARWDWVRQMGFSLLGQRVVSVLTRVEVDYLKEIGAGNLEVATCFVRPDDDWRHGANYKVTVRQTISGRNGIRLAGACSTLAFIDTATRRIGTLQDWLAQQHASKVALGIGTPGMTDASR